ncbi:hypothetical protein NQD34_007474 [Periophthalmus magnuspinnatus]|nr:hypothetical protein NQD34_007474 [Periophthalmus magnuspinnatus]
MTNFLLPPHQQSPCLQRLMIIHGSEICCFGSVLLFTQWMCGRFAIDISKDNTRSVVKRCSWSVSPHVVMWCYLRRRCPRDISHSTTPLRRHGDLALCLS